MEFQMEYWHWFALGVILALSEIFIPSFTVLWFGLGAGAVALILFLFPSISLAAQIIIWLVFSIFFIILWFRFLRQMLPDKSMSGMSREAITGESGHVISLPAEGKHGIVRFTTPVLGSDEWPFICDDDVQTGDKVYIRDISGNTLIVSKTR